MNTINITKKGLLDIFEAFTTRVEILSAEQVTLVRFFRNTPNYRVIAKMAGVNEATIARRLKKIARHICRDNFPAALSKNSNLTPEEMEILKDHFVNGLSIRTIAKNKNLSFYSVRKTIRQMRNL